MGGNQYRRSFGFVFVLLFSFCHFLFQPALGTRFHTHGGDGIAHVHSEAEFNIPSSRKHRTAVPHTHPHHTHPPHSHDSHHHHSHRPPHHTHHTHHSDRAAHPVFRPALDNVAHCHLTATFALFDVSISAYQLPTFGNIPGPNFCLQHNSCTPLFSYYPRAPPLSR